MEALDTLVLSRIQFAANISFHILFPTITIALGWALLFFKLRFQWTGDAKWMEAYRFWVKVFALSFAMGVVSGITMSFQFGTNWPGFMETVGNVAGPLLAYEVMTAFFLEAVFLGIMLFGWRKVPSWLHTTATFLVAFGTTMSAFWILVLNSWMHTPQGFELRDGVVHATSWMEIVFNPSMPYRLAHMLLASGLTVAFLILGIAAFRRLLGDQREEVRSQIRFGAVLAAVLIPVQIFAGDMHGLNTQEYQPAKVAAMEGNWSDTDGRTPLVLFAIPDPEARENRFEVAIPNGASLILGHKPEHVVPSLDEFVTEDGEMLHPPVAKVFWAFRVMVGTGMAMLALSWITVLHFARKREDANGVRRRWVISTLPRPLLWAMVAMTFSGWLATLAGWYVTEIGRQPWLVSGVLTTAEAVAQVPAGMVLSTLLGYLAVYAFLTLAYVSVIFYLARRAARGNPVGTLESPGSGQAEVEAIAGAGPRGGRGGRDAPGGGTRGGGLQPAE
ncbi:cytochrome bd-I ubiquinol oxidase subunit 1 apoprotein [Hasllibacter halocynthiae]|uniref:Cytochrome bd-I ubiquinol oxidase subunit 1 apoprotein n=1 Tax=Hasllibacter halocynthiae TaxID=595589 RepID=A0A2T0X661_9RHOB|nr:cytochrome ubiquinol oxidase subunit I [Hasllibacter halocynthiae]PRY94416.1 cytochrome bd-I ubiquinol oxidase subunit 1 apoprotein [Hasllibacter halocynthiae]